MVVLYCGEPRRGETWRALLAERAPDIRFRIWPEAGDLAEIDYVVAWTLPPDLFGKTPRLKAVLSVGAGVDQLDLASIPPQLRVARMIEPGLIKGMVSFTTMAVLAVHRDLPAYIAQQRERVWRPILPLAPCEARGVGLMGAGLLGSAVLRALAPFGFKLRAWTRSPRAIEGVACFAGEAELAAFLAATDILVCLLPLTAATRGILDARLFAALPQGASLIAIGRGGHLVEPDLTAALDSGKLAAAILDVFETEPLPPEHPFWAHPRILVAPHVASRAEHESALEVLLANLRALARGEPIRGEIDRARQY